MRPIDADKLEYKCRGMIKKPYQEGKCENCPAFSISCRDIAKAKTLDVIAIPKGATVSEVINMLFPDMVFQERKSGMVKSYFGDIWIKKEFWEGPFKEND